MYKCDEILVAADVARVSTNESVAAILKESLGRNLKNERPSLGISLVCTKTDVLYYYLYFSKEIVLTTWQIIDENEMRRVFFANDRSENEEQVKLLKRTIEEAEINDELRRSVDAKEKWVFTF